MSLRLRLIIAFLLLSVVPLGAVTLYSYRSSAEALRAAAERETDLLAGELSQRMTLVTAQLSDRVEHLADVAELERRVEQANESGAKSDAVTADDDPIGRTVAMALGEAAVLLNNVELRGVRGRGRFPPRPPGAPPAPDRASSRTDSSRASGPPSDQAGIPRPDRGGLLPPDRAGMSPPDRSGMPPSQAAAPPPPPPVPAPNTEVRASPGRSDRRGQGSRGSTGVATAPAPTEGPSATPSVAAGAAGRGANQAITTVQTEPGSTREKILIDLAPVRREIARAIVPEGKQFENLTPEQRERLGRELNARMLGIVEGIKLGAAELQKQAEVVKQREAAAAKAQAAASPSMTPVRKKAELTGNRLGVTVEQDGKIVQEVSAEIHLPNVLATVFSTPRTDRGEVPFAVGSDGRIYTRSDDDRALVESLGDVVKPDGPATARHNDWIVVTTKDPSGAGLKLGIATPVGDSLADLRKTTGRNLAVGFGFIFLALIGIVPLSRSLSRPLTQLSEAVRRIADGDYSARVPVKGRDEIGQLAIAVNQMATDVERHQHAAIGQERLKRELELGRQIQNEMLPHAPLKLGLTEIEGVSVPAREVGGDFFNYFVLPGGEVALLVGDVSGKGVGAALLMANVQASLRTRLSMGQQLSEVAAEIDRDIEANSPGPLYATLFVGILDPATRVFRYVNAGHHPQYVLRGGGLERLSSTGLPVGLFAGRGYVERQVQLQAGDLLFFYTDGCVEAENDRDEPFGAERLESLLAGPTSTTAEVLGRVEATVTTFRGQREPFDDATMMAVKVG
jgi:serine phosphatase RsbU (regulator of sigma subunit)